MTRRREWQGVYSADSRDPRASKARFRVHARKVRTVNCAVDCRSDARTCDARVAVRPHRANGSVTLLRRRNRRSVANMQPNSLRVRAELDEVFLCLKGPGRPRLES